MWQITLNLVKARDSVNGVKLQYAIDLNKGLFTFIPNESDGTGGQSSELLRQEFDSNAGDDIY